MAVLLTRLNPVRCTNRRAIGYLLDSKQEQAEQISSDLLLQAL